MSADITYFNSLLHRGGRNTVYSNLVSASTSLGNRFLSPTISVTNKTHLIYLSIFKFRRNIILKNNTLNRFECCYLIVNIIHFKILN